jgi:hypothetical protein
VELVQRGNAVLNGKQEAFRGFSEIFAEELASAMPETKGEVQRVMQNAGLEMRRVEMEARDQRGGEQEGRPESGQEGWDCGELFWNWKMFLGRMAEILGVLMGTPCATGASWQVLASANKQRERKARE